MVEATSDRERVIERMMRDYSLSSAKAARSYLQVPHTLGFVETVGLSVYLSQNGRRELVGPDPLRVREALVTRIAGVEELLSAISKRPLRMGGAQEAMRRSGFGWATQAQTRYRLRWLEEVGDVERVGCARPEYRLTSLGSERR